MATTQTASKSNRSRSADGDSGHSLESIGGLDELTAFLKENWKSIVGELAVAAVTAYFNYNGRDKKKSRTGGRKLTNFSKESLS